MTTHLRSAADRRPAHDAQARPDTFDDSLGDQTRYERHALALLARRDVRAAVDRSAQRWQDGTPGLLPETYRQLQPSIAEVALLVALQVVDDDAGRPGVVEISAGPHTWGGLTVPGGRWGINNPDTLYFAAPVTAHSTYILHGRAPRHGPTDINVSVQIRDVWTVLANLGREELHGDGVGGVDGDFSIVIGNDPDASAGPGGGANRLPIPPDATVVLIRQTLTDWSIQRPYELSIERVGGRDDVRRADDDELARRLIDRLADVVEHNLAGLQQPILGHPINTIPQPDPPGSKPGYLTAQRSALGRFRLADDEALVVTLTPGGAGYAAIAATTVWGVAADSDRHQNSLNTAQADLDPEGRLTVVVANRDPGVVNWLDPGGFAEGILMLRWQLLDQRPAHPTSGQGPGVQVRAVRLSDLRAAVPADTAWLSGPGQREDQLAARAAAYRHRFERS